MKQQLVKIRNLTLQATVSIVEKKNFKNINDTDIDNLAETIELLNDIYEVLYDKVFEDSKNI